MAGICEHGIENLVSVKDGKFLDQLNDYHRVEDSVICRSTLLIRIREVEVSNLGREIGYND
jgi:hypothetical protein